MNFTEIERAIVDLGIIGQVKKNSKISVSDPSYLTIQDHIPFVTPSLRFWYKDDKDKSVNRIKTLVNNCERYLSDSNLQHNLHDQIIDGLAAAIEGLKNLEYTYSISHSVSGQIKLVIIPQIYTLLEKHQKHRAASPIPASIGIPVTPYQARIPSPGTPASPTVPLGSAYHTRSRSSSSDSASFTETTRKRTPYSASPKSVASSSVYDELE